MIEKPVQFLSNGKQLVGMLHQPEKENKIVVVMCHGFTGDKTENKRLFVETARAFTKAGFAAFRFDLFGSGDSPGEFSETRISINLENIRDALQTVRKMGFEQIVVLGISMGAASAILTLADKAVAGLILWSTVPDMRELFEDKLGGPLELAPVLPQYEYNGWLIDRNFYLDAVKYNIAEKLKTMTMPKLIVQGSGDDAVFRRGFARFKTIAPQPVQFAWIEGAGHTYETVKQRREVIRITLNWLQERFKK
ncbi:MAG TPA: alpha/beta fold hydrolase [Bacteroidetes bacterium]|nr:alpha/beta fold hydrolase [Bacteroidota bacterium]